MTATSAEYLPDPWDIFRSRRLDRPRRPPGRGERGLLIVAGMKILEARFYPHSLAHDGAVVIGRVICDDDRVFVEFANVSQAAVRPFVLQAIHKKLSFLVEPTTPAAFDLLKGYRSDFWSFVEISSNDSQHAAHA